MIDGKNFFDQPLKSKGQGDDYTTGCLLHYFHFKHYYKMMASYLSKQKVLDANLKVM